MEWNVSTMGRVGVGSEGNSTVGAVVVVRLILVVLILGPGVGRLRDADFEFDILWQFLLGLIVDILSNHFCGGLIAFGQHLVKYAMIKSAFQQVTLGPAQGTKVGHHYRMWAVLGGVELAGDHLNSDSIGMPMHPSTRPIVVANGMGGVKGELG
jgi:uncharacterized integral membrane protein